MDRQMRVARRVADELGLEIEEVMMDKGVSGFTGANRTRGALGVFLGRVDNGEIARNSVLIIEDQDRLSREKPFQVLGIIEAFREAGIRVITSSHQELTSDEEYQGLHNYLTAMRATGESDRKSDLITKGLIEKCERWMAGEYCFKDKGRQGGPIGAGVPPFWIEWDDAKREYRLKAEKVRAIKKMIELYRAGLGAGVIADRLKASGLTLTDDTERNKSGSLTRVIHYILKSPALMGVRQLEVGKQRGRQKDTSKIRTYNLEGYFPAIVTHAEFVALEQTRQKRSNKTGAKSDIVNVLTGTQVCYCGFCGYSMTGQNQLARMINKDTGKPMRGERRLLCGSYIYKTACPHRGTMQAYLVEQAILKTCADEFNLAHLMKIDAKHDGMVARLATLHNEIAELEGEKEQSGKLAMKAKSDEQQEHWLTEQDKAMRAITKKIKEVDTLDYEIRQMQGTAETATADVWESLIDGVLNLDPDTRISARKLVSDTFERIEVFNDGYDGANPAVIDVELTSKRGGMISLQINRKTGGATAKLVTRKKKAALKAA
jgi:Resolvase, N terminal domain/Recombinase